MANKSYNGLEWVKNSDYPPIFGQSAHSVDNTVAEPHHTKASESNADTSADCPFNYCTHICRCKKPATLCATPKGRSESGSSQPSSPPPASLAGALTRSEAVFLVTGMIYGYESSEHSETRFKLILGNVNGWTDDELVSAIKSRFYWLVSIRG
jgi:hypothetical protein